MLLVAGKCLVSFLCVIVDNTNISNKFSNGWKKRKAVNVTFTYQMLISLFTGKV
jgi:heterodisulfide reductase subunit A-like polyferredoxin